MKWTFVTFIVNVIVSVFKKAVLRSPHCKQDLLPLCIFYSFKIFKYLGPVVCYSKYMVMVEVKVKANYCSLNNYLQYTVQDKSLTELHTHPPVV